MANNVKKLTLASKLAKQGAVIQPTTIIKRATSSVRDIEDLVVGGAAASTGALYFSPIQTRKQRLLNGETIQKTATKEVLIAARVPQKKKRNQQSSLAAGAEGEPAIQKEAAVKKEGKTRIKKEVEEQKEKEPKAEVKKKLKPEIKQQIDPLVNEDVVSPQSLWYRQLENIRTMRSLNAAPVDTMGCHQCADPSADGKTQRFQKLVALMLSSQTKDQTTYEAMNRLKARTLTPDSLKDMPVGELETLLHPVSFYKNKAKYLKQTTQILIDKYDADIPDNVKELIALPGVGPKMAHICMAVAWDKLTGIGVDVHVHRISNRLGWLPRPTKEPEQTRVGLESWLPSTLWAEVNHLFVGFGQTICTPLKPNCGQCLNKDICPSAKMGATPTKKGVR
ncbi:endonuclease III-like protein 1 [Drosophila guanche]|uniref:Endonuclease III homolog n=1 Tax=Drosophila guanche TaxID=7266 RepID=A0A3B0K7S9_DROGU|nr:endonuclease III-like protein 1 [Drosophila guanche]SPP79578.1 blast:Endonuclease III-like protein 1 [Drosophila guanche]